MRPVSDVQMLRGEGDVDPTATKMHDGWSQERCELVLVEEHARSGTQRTPLSFMSMRLEVSRGNPKILSTAVHAVLEPNAALPFINHMGPS